MKKNGQKGIEEIYCTNLRHFIYILYIVLIPLINWKWI